MNPINEINKKILINNNNNDDNQGPDLYAFIGFIGFIGPDDDDIN